MCNKKIGAINMAINIDEAVLKQQQAMERLDRDAAAARRIAEIRREYQLDEQNRNMTNNLSYALMALAASLIVNIYLLSAIIG
jgi:hypothetical protein